MKFNLSKKREQFFNEMSNHTPELAWMKNYFRHLLIICGFVIAFSNIVLGVTLMPEVARVSINKFTPAITSIGILLQGIITFVLTIHFAFKDYEEVKEK